MINTFNIYRSTIFLFRLRFYTSCDKTTSLDLTGVQVKVQVIDQLSNIVATIPSTVGDATGIVDVFIDQYLPVTSLRFRLFAEDTVSGNKVIFTDIKDERVADAEVDFITDSFDIKAGTLDAPVFYNGIINNKY